MRIIIDIPDNTSRIVRYNIKGIAFTPVKDSISLQREIAYICTTDKPRPYTGRTRTELLTDFIQRITRYINLSS